MYVGGGAKMGKTRNDQQWQRIFNGEGGGGFAVCFVAVSSNSFLLFRLICFLRT